MFEKEKQKEIELKETSNQDNTPASDSDADLIGKIVGDHFKILELIGQGGLGVVYKAQHEYLGTICAIKFLLSEKTSEGKHMMRFQREAKAASDLHHPNIAGVQDFGVYNGAPFIVMEYVDGIPLDRIIEDQKAIAPETVRTILKQAAEALSYAHGKMIVHRDIKPANIVICKDKNGNVVTKIIDFGIAKIIEAEEARNLTQTGEVFGTPNYMSPEQCQGKKADFRSDLYSLGCVAYEMLSGHPPFTADSAIEVIMKHVNEPAKRLKNVAGGLDQIVARLLAKEPKHRYATADSLLVDLNLVEKGARVSPYVDRNEWGRKLRKVAMVSLYVFCLSLIILISYTHRDSTVDWTNRINAEPSNARNYFERATLYNQKNEHTKALVDFTKAIRLEPNNADYYIGRSLYFSGRGDMASCISDCTKAIALAPQNYEPYVIRAKARHSLGDSLEETIKDATNGIKYNPKNLKQYNFYAYSLRAKAESILGQPDKALSDAQAALKILPGMKERLHDGWVLQPHITKIEALWALGRRPESIAYLDEVIKRFPDSASLIAIRAKTRLHSGDAAGAMTDIDEALTLLPSQHTFYETKARVLLALKKPEEAIGTLDQSTGTSNCAEDWSIKGMAQLQLDNIAEAKKCWIKADKLYKELPSTKHLKKMIDEYETNKK